MKVLSDRETRLMHSIMDSLKVVVIDRYRRIGTKHALVASREHIAWGRWFWLRSGSLFQAADHQSNDPSRCLHHLISAART